MTRPNSGAKAPLTATRSHRRVAAMALLTLGLALAGPAQPKDTGQLFISSEKDNGLVVVDAAKTEVTGAIALCKRPRHMQLTPDRLRLPDEAKFADHLELDTEMTICVPDGRGGMKKIGRAHV